ncbi:2-amino-4-hydroxy-6-hydroxymethyldihydropteridinediphosphokinase [Flexibacter flexilis DSM 6793]|uniref:2-amino-4-hydroxy-6-hydroxymethyldihydropteridine pyrophosphokinase n=1 Tax=Flexibacter flexilis DSM 6793 TaxID=927664 RepID=A0A1I1FWM3_9BACT|nr:2-amino-4-hydroxy-6-hydroxymethyldihydropteridine diphosphokinase [Flexibacter flexilis]SFC01453.1 2-amino-4-hydroxy-6-hydroxymethyldihydropteridinediphosphokinase [Flexibacter flexilis DSM 6793]
MTQQTTDYHWLIGGNLSDRLDYLARARALMAEQIGQILQTSGIYQTQAWGYTDQPDFLNQAIITRSALPPQQAMQAALHIEQQLGRERHQRWHERTIDIDLIYAQDFCLETPNLTLPHPRAHERRFVLVPLAEISPDFIHPIWHKSQAELLQLCADTSAVETFKLLI